MKNRLGLLLLVPGALAAGCNTDRVEDLLVTTSALCPPAPEAWQCGFPGGMTEEEAITWADQCAARRDSGQATDEDERTRCQYSNISCGSCVGNTFKPGRWIIRCAAEPEICPAPPPEGEVDPGPFVPEEVVLCDHEGYLPGDANRDGEFTTADLVQVFQAGEYEDEIENNSTWEEGDWDCDGDFTTADLVLAFRVNGQPT